jgi:hypothetical protein
MCSASQDKSWWGHRVKVDKVQSLCTCMRDKLDAMTERLAQGTLQACTSQVELAALSRLGPALPPSMLTQTYMLRALLASTADLSCLMSCCSNAASRMTCDALIQ